MQISGFKIMLFGFIVVLFGGLLHRGVLQHFGGIPVIICAWGGGWLAGSTGSRNNVTGVTRCSRISVC